MIDRISEFLYRYGAYIVAALLTIAFLAFVLTVQLTTIGG